MKQRYITIDFRGGKLELIDTINGIIDEYLRQGYRMTVRQLYYQLVARAVVENTLQSYKRVADIVNDGRLAGLIDWSAIEDRTREFIRRTHWESASEILNACARSFHMDMWEGQDQRVFVIVEKEALVGVLERVCHEYDVPLLAARGYPSSSVVRDFAIEDLVPCIQQGQRPVILHLGDHDPSGIDMSRDLSERFAMFINGEAGHELYEDNFKRLALNMPQVQELRPPPNPAKITDSRYESYIRRFGHQSWELDALPPDYLDRLVRREITRHIAKTTWDTRVKQIEEIKSRIAQVAGDFDD